MLKSMKHFFDNLSIKTKIFVLYTVIVFLTFLVFMESNAYLTTRETRKEVGYSATKSLNQTKSFLDYKSIYSKEIVNILAANSELQRILKKDLASYKADIGNWTLDRDSLYKAVFASKTNPDIKEVKIYMDHGPAAAFESSSLYTMATFRGLFGDKDQEFKAASNLWLKGSALSDSTSDDTIILLKGIVDISNYKKNIGIIRLDFDAKVFTSVLNEANITEYSYAFLMNTSEILCSSDLKDTEGSKQLQQKVETYVRDQHIKHYPYWNNHVSVNDQVMMIGVEQIASTDWQLVLVIPEQDILSTISSTKQQYLLLILLILPLAFVMTYVVTTSFTRRLAKLASEMHDLDTTTFFKELSPANHDEIGILTQNFNYMLTKISMLLDEKYELGQTAKNAELIALQAQINPHFLYNTLDQLYWMGVKYDVPEISQLVIDLSKFYKLSLSKGKSIVTLENELALVQAYVNIQNVRFDHIIHLNIDVPDDALSFTLPKITLQPLVENAVLHGICEKDGAGRIDIRVRELTEGIAITVHDDGVGMDEETLERLLQSSDDPNTAVVTSFHGYGLNNIRQRLQNYFGDGFTLNVSSVPEEGTTLTILLPTPPVIE